MEYSSGTGKNLMRLLGRSWSNHESGFTVEITCQNLRSGVSGDRKARAFPSLKVCHLTKKKHQQQCWLVRRFRECVGWPTVANVHAQVSTGRWRVGQKDKPCRVPIDNIDTYDCHPWLPVFPTTSSSAKRYRVSAVGPHPKMRSWKLHATKSSWEEYNRRSTNKKCFEAENSSPESLGKRYKSTDQYWRKSEKSFQPSNALNSRAK